MESHVPSANCITSSAASETSNGEEVSDRITPESYRDIISTLPKEDGCRVLGDLYLYQGHWYYSYLLEGAMFAQDHYEAQPSDIILCDVPKTGNTWLKALTFAIVTRTDVFANSTAPNLLTKYCPHDCVPLMEIDFARKGVKPDLGSLPLIATHMPYASLPKSIIDSGCKIVYICREPKDSLVSLWHFGIKLRPEIQKSISLEEFFEFYCKGICDFGPYWDHVLGYWKASLDRPETVLFLKYEDLIRDTSFYVKRIADFMGYPFSLEEEKDRKVEKVVELCSFEHLSNLEVNKTGMHNKDNYAFGNKAFFRKGKIGDWKNCLAPEMAKRLDNITEQKLGEYGLSFHCL